MKAAFVVDESLAKSLNLEQEKLRKVLTGGKQVKKYFIKYENHLLIYMSDKDNIKKFPCIKNHLDTFKDQIKCKEVSTNKHSMYSLHRPRNDSIFSKPRKALGVITEDEIVIAIDDSKYFATDGLYLFNVSSSINLNFVVSILNSKLMKFLYRLYSSEEGRVLAQVKPTIINQLPIRVINFSDQNEVAQHDRLVALVETMLTLHKQLAAARLPDEKERLQRQIQSTDRAIDTLVYQLYDLTPEEIAIVEGS